MNNVTQTIYVVDDDEAMRDSMTWLLEGEGYVVACFDSGESFLNARSAEMRGYLILDVRMPEMSGLELHEKLDALGSQLPIIFVTGHGDVPMAVSALQRGACDFIEKPFHNEDLLSRIVRALLEGSAPHEILAITFTKKAAGEMRQRLQELLEQFSTQSDAELSHGLIQRGFTQAPSKSTASSPPAACAMAPSATDWIN